MQVDGWTTLRFLLSFMPKLTSLVPTEVYARLSEHVTS